jgi:precorrin-2 dehydrogenase/sirohydrochlorin ferrochelatase
VTGGGHIALPKARQLVEAGARVTVVSPQFAPGFAELSATLVQREFEPGDLDGMFLAIAATDDPEANRSVGEICQARGILCNVVDDPEVCGFYLNSVLRRGDLQIAVSTGGAAPALAKRLREDLEPLFPADYGEYLDFLRQARGQARSRVAVPALRARIAYELASEAGYQRFRQLDAAQRSGWVEQVIAQNQPETTA